MTNLTHRIVVRLHDAKLQQDLRRDEAGLTMLAYALGAAIIVVPLGAAVLTLGTDTVTDVESSSTPRSRRQARSAIPGARCEECR